MLIFLEVKKLSWFNKSVNVVYPSVFKCGVATEFTFQD